LLVVVAAGLAAQLTFMLPNWLVVVVSVELLAGWDLLAELGVVELVQTQMVSAEQSVKKLFEMIPRYRGE
jgi:hypothetical protein